MSRKYMLLNQITGRWEKWIVPAVVLSFREKELAESEGAVKWLKEVEFLINKEFSEANDDRDSREDGNGKNNAR